MHQGHLAIASVPVQSWGAIYEPQKALLIGTIFQDLDLPFYMAEDDVQSPHGVAACIKGGKMFGEEGRSSQPLVRTTNALTEMPSGTPSEMPSQTPAQTPSPASPGMPGSVTEIPVREPGKLDEIPLNTPGKSGEQEKRETLLCQFYAVSFALDDLRLYMDTHPKDKSGLKLLKDAVRTRSELLKDFADQFYPLTMDCMADIYEKNPESECYCWEKGPLPWEGACV